ncbi:endonuclease/exonuclease/phosphatase family protein [Mucilaginibacter terrae]|uniref:Endonuclease/exonuclease/phosphatase (EEP) superfamily protein YafD n=1 Tax=Mucilaginibacter terrae TaxID=1955052 RepID=A0ABU3GWR2_9SPHI|nr:endonuclease/exonuclease/phosphatase family protein [Mucilaginibacter terrae]MDT3404051.1 endonuclease/exonuclease/phosphatase (EEP) superfamily protein YafD [Mucilaginibacter terrae]
MHIFNIIYSSLLFVFTLLPLVRHDYWIFRVFDYPRLQKLVLNITGIGLWIIFYQRDSIIDLVFLVALSVNTIFLTTLIWPFTPFGKKQVLAVSKSRPGQSISLMITNVLEDNDNYEGCLAEIAKADPDVVILLETNKNWDEQTRKLEENYTYHVRVPLENTYGLLLYSKLKLEDTSVKYLVEKDIPSIHTRVILPCGQPVQLYAVHPTPPVPGENVRSTERDKELLLVADLAKACNLPVIVAGDLNDVAWSHTTELFLKMSGLLDPRRGRGFFNSFNAHHPFMRFPLDHAFTSRHFKLKQIKRLNNFGSDHFPIYLNMQFEPEAVKEQEPLRPDADEIEEAQEKKAKI